MDINVIAGVATYLIAALLLWLATHRLEKALEHRAEAANMLAEARDERADALRINAETASMIAHAPISADQARRVYADLADSCQAEAGVK
ncbi:hypothetical protein PQI23_08480 [Leucobacter sp. USCH14]|uniref:hypothetical protein n=1 Tax=Leucobacter sp. USCH14 TaxID=3024838 RepID=UPI0030A57F9C